MSWIEALDNKLSQHVSSEFNYIETKDIKEADNIDYGATGVYMECTIIYFEIKNLAYMLKENGRRKAAIAYTMYRDVLTAIADRSGAFVNCYSPNAFLIVYPGRDESIPQAVKGAMNIAYAVSETFKKQFSAISGLEFSMGLDHGHIMGTKNQSDCGYDHMSWFGTCIFKAIRISKECGRPFYIGLPSSVYHLLNEDMKRAERRILGFKKPVDIWNKISYQYENVKKHLYQTNHKLNIEDEEAK